MKPVVSIGTQSFEKLRRNHSFYVDKTLLIREWWENQDDVTLVARPRRFGKTLNLDMLECFFSREYAGREDLFAGLAIWEEEKYRRLQGSRPVIFLSFATVRGKDYETARDGIVQILINLYARYEYLARGDVLSPREKEYFDYIKNDMSDAVAAMALHRLSLCMSRYYGKKAIILLDEYDTPLQEAFVNGYWDKMTELLRSMFNAAFKTNPYMERAFLTGITRVGRESTFSDLNNLTVVTTTSEMYRTQFGFTEKEVFDAMDLFGLSGEKDRVKAWYDGFAFGSQRDIYNPWSITNFLKERTYKPYWANSSSNSLVGTLISEGTPEVKMIVEDLMAGGTLTVEIDEEIVFHQLRKKRNAVWSLLLAGGYLRVEEKVFDQEAGSFVYVLRLTNREVSIMFRNMIRDWFSGDDVPYNEFLKALLGGDVKRMNQYMNKVALETFSFFDTGGRADPERFYHGFVLGLIAELAGRYRITSNRERRKKRASSFGRYDVMLEPLGASDPAFVLEFKVHDPEDGGTLADTVQAAHRQMEEKAYDTELTARGIQKSRIRCYGFAFEGKKVLIG